MIKILIVSPISIFPNTRGSTNRILELAKGLKKAGAMIFIARARERVFKEHSYRHRCSKLYNIKAIVRAQS